MSEKRKDSDFVVSDRRLFTADGELRSTSVEEEAEKPEAKQPPAATPAPPAKSAAEATSRIEAPLNPDMPAPPTASEQQAQHDAYRKSSKDMDRRVELSGHSAKELEVTFRHFMASLYMTAMMQLGLMHEQGGQPAVDLIGARQTIDTLGLLAEKTKGNLDAQEQGFLQNCLYELRMAYVEVTNALARPPQTPAPGTGTNG